MNCDTVLEQIEDYFDGISSKEISTSIKSHIDECKSCQKLVEEHRLYKQTIVSIEVEPMGASDAARLLRQAKHIADNQRAHKSQRFAFMKGFSAALVMACTLMLANQVIQPNTVNHTTPTIASAQNIHNVNVIIYVPVDMPGAEIALTLPSYMTLDGYEDMRTIAWNTDLGEGANQLVLPVHVKPGTELNGTHIIAATIGYNNKSKTFDLRVDLTAVQNSDWGAFTAPIFSPNKSV